MTPVFKAGKKDGPSNFRFIPLHPGFSMFERIMYNLYYRQQNKKMICCNGSSYRRCSVKEGVLRNFVKFTGKHLCQSLFFNIKLQTFAKFLRTLFCFCCKQYLLHKDHSRSDYSHYSFEQKKFEAEPKLTLNSQKKLLYFPGSLPRNFKQEKS